jgi:hypothetical protein
MAFALNVDELETNLVLKEAGYRGICDLDNDIHPMWSRERFRIGNFAEQAHLSNTNNSKWDQSPFRLSQKTYERIEPALRLASLLLEHSGPFFSQVLHGQRKLPKIKRLQPMGAVSEWKMCWVHEVRNPEFSPEVVAAQLTTFTDHVAANSLVYFNAEGSELASWGEIRLSLEERCRYLIGIGDILARVICFPVWHQTPAQTRRYYNFQLATTLLHELAHVAWRARHWTPISGRPRLRMTEAVLNTEEEQIELGQSWERWFLGGELQPLETGETPPRWLGFSFVPFNIDTGNSDSLNYRDDGHGGHAIPASCINQFFQKTAWAAHRDGSIPFEIHLTPPASLTNGVWDESHGEAFMSRLELNHSTQTNPRPSFPDESPEPNIP